MPNGPATDVAPNNFTTVINNPPARTLQQIYDESIRPHLGHIYQLPPALGGPEVEFNPVIPGLREVPVEESNELTQGDLNEAQAEVLGAILELAGVEEVDADEAVKFARAAEIWVRVLADLGDVQVVPV